MKSITVRSIVMVFAFGLLSFGVASARFPAPQLMGITSTEPGKVMITMQVAPGEEGYFGAFLVYRREGTHSTPDDKFEVLSRMGYPHYFMDTVGTPEFTHEEGLLRLVVSGVKSGNYSFYITQVAPWMTGSESEPSNVLTIHVSGNSTEDGFISGTVVPGDIAGVDDPLVVTGSLAYPNPAVQEVHIPTGAGGEARLRVFNATGGMVLNRPVEAGTADCRLDVTALPAGEYFAEIVRGATISRSRFTVLR